MRANTPKCVFYSDSLEFLGHPINSHGIYHSQANVYSIPQASAPTNTKELKALLGIINFYIRFLNERSEVVVVLHKLQDNGSRWDCALEHHIAYNHIK